jgi:undecaprenyl-diphosphatase
MLSRTHRIALAAIAFLLVAMIGLAVHSGWTKAIDARLLAAIRHAGGLSLRQAVVDLTALGGGTVLIAINASVILLLWLRRERIGALRLLGIVLGGRYAVDLVKGIVARSRPPSLDPGIVLHSWSFPSSHAANATITYLALALIATHGRTRPAERRLLLGLAALLALTIGLSRVWLGVHWPSDVLAGWLFGVGWVALTSTVPVPRR